MKFSYETQGANSYMVCEVGDDEELDSLSLGMITNNKIPGFVAALFTQINDKKYIKYNISAKVPAEQLFAGTVNRKQLLGVFGSIMNAILAAEEYMIDEQSLLFDLKNIYVDVSTYTAELICVPLQNTKDLNLNIFLKNIMFNTRFDESENCDYVAKIISFLNASSVVSAKEFKKLIGTLMNPEGGAAIVQNGMSQDLSDAAVDNVYSDSEDMRIISNNMNDMAENQENINTLHVHREVQYNNSNMMSGTNKSTSSINQSNGKNEPIPQIKRSAQGFAIPNANGQASYAGNTKLDNKKAEAVQTDTEKPISLGYLLMHYNSENAAQYKAQKKRKGSSATTNMDGNTVALPIDKKTAKKQKKTKKSNNMPYPGMQQEMNPNMMNNHSGMQNMQQGMNPNMMNNRSDMQNVQHMDMQNVGNTRNFGETVVLNASAGIGETTVLGVSAQSFNPYLIRQKSNEKIEINKPIFRIGKEKSYVDYFISDNSAVSRSHVNIIKKEAKYYVVDTNSTNHTYINGAMIPCNQEIEIMSGDKLRLANEEFEFHIG